MGTENTGARKQQKAKPKRQQQQHDDLKKRALPSAAVAAGVNWKNSSLKHDRLATSSKPGKQRKAAKKVSSKPREGTRVIHVVVPSPSKKLHKGIDRHHGHGFPRGKRHAAPRDDEDEEGRRSHGLPEPVNSPSAQSSLDVEIADFVRFVSLTPKERVFRLRVFTEMKELICATFQDATVQLYGSSSNGLDTFRSDLDITVGNITLSNSLRSAVHSTMDGADGDELEGDPGSDDEDYEDERYQPPPQAFLQAVQATTKETDDEPSFSLNIAMPAGSSNNRNGSYPYTTAASSSLAKSPWNPTLRRKKIRVLRALQYLLKVKRPQFQVKCLQKAKIPILMVRDPKSQLSIDVGVNREAFEASDHGRTTTLVIELQQVLGATFIQLVTFLKEFLHQFELDKPFTGGLGSFRLYIMVAKLFPLAKGSDGRVQLSHAIPSVSNLLRTFFHVFSNKRKPHYLQSSTVLKLPFDDSTVDFASVFRLSDCVDAFAMAHDILTKTESLGAIIFEDKLATEREQVRKAVVAQLEPVSSARNQRSGHNVRRLK